MAVTLLGKPTGFDGFGPSMLVQQMRGRLRGVQFPNDRLDARKLLRQNSPLVPGVYGWLDSNRRLIYVGKSKSLRKRLLSYFAKKPSDNRMDRIRQHSEFIVWEPISHELLALIREQELIHRWRPEYNSMGQPTRMQPAFLCIGGSPAPNARLVRRLTGKYSHVFGPISGTNRLQQAIIRLNQVFRLRDCPDKTRFQFTSQRLLFDDPATAKCIRHEIGTCPGPCASLCSLKDYRRQVDEMLCFLDGNSQSTLDAIENRMKEAARREAFETAAIHRDCWEHLSWLDRRLQTLRMADKHLSGILPIPARRNRTAWMVLRGGRIGATMLAPENADQATSARKLIVQIAGRAADSPTNLLEMSLQLIVVSWFRHDSAHKQELLGFDAAIRDCERRTSQACIAA